MRRLTDSVEDYLMQRIMLIAAVALLVTTDATAGPLRRLFCRTARPAACQSAPVQQRPAYLPATMPVSQPPVVFAGPVPTMIRTACAGGVCPK